MFFPTAYLSVIQYTRNIQLFTGLLYFLTVISIFVWCLVLLSTIVRSLVRRHYTRPTKAADEAPLRIAELE